MQITLFFSLVWKVRVFGTRKWIISILAARNGTVDPSVAQRIVFRGFEIL